MHSLESSLDLTLGAAVAVALNWTKCQFSCDPISATPTCCCKRYAYRSSTVFLPMHLLERSLALTLGAAVAVALFRLSTYAL